MFVKNIEFGIPNTLQYASDPNWAMVESHLRLLNGEADDGIVLQSAGASYMAVSGGMHDEFVVGGYLEGFGSFICASGKRGGGIRNVCVNGDFNQYPPENVVDLSTVIMATRSFFEYGTLTEQLQWERRR
jgi:hypothetical protein